MIDDNGEIEKGNSTMVKNTLPDMEEINGLPGADHYNLLFQKEYYKLSHRAQNILEDIDIFNFSNACDYFIIHQGKIDFGYVRNVGVKTNSELKSMFNELESGFYSQNGIAKEYRNGNESLPDDRVRNVYPGIVPEFNNKMELEFRTKLKTITYPTKGILKLIKAKTIKDFHQYFFIKNQGNLNFNIKNCGAASTKEIIKLKKIVNEIIDQYKSDSIASGLFSDLEFYIKAPDFAKKYRREIFNRCLNIHEGEQCQMYEDWGNDLNLTRSKVKQVANEFPNRIRKVLVQFVKNGYTEINQYFKGDYFIIDDVYAETINKKEETNFSKHLICYVLSQTLPDDYGYYGFLNKLSKYSGIFYRKDLLLNVRDCLNLIRKLYRDTRKSTSIKIELEKILEQSGFKPESQDINASFLQAKRQLVEIIGHHNNCLPANRRIIRVKDNYLIFNTRSVINIYKSAIEVLRASNKPMHYREIYARLIENNKFVSSVSSLHSAIMNRPEYFGIKGSGHYGLREWGGYFGSIGDVAEQILAERNAPINREELYEILCRELYISRVSIMRVLFHYKFEDRFMRYKNDTVALKRWFSMKR